MIFVLTLRVPCCMRFCVNIDCTITWASCVWVSITYWWRPRNVAISKCSNVCLSMSAWVRIPHLSSGMSLSCMMSLLWRYNGHNGVSNHQPHDCLLNRSFRRRSKKTPKPRVTGLCAGNSPVTGEFPAQMASNAENVPIWWRHHVYAFPCASIYFP